MQNTEGDIRLKNKAFISFLSSYLLILFISALLYAIGYQSLMSVIQNQMEKNNISILEQNRIIIEQQFQEIAVTTNNIRRDMRIVYYQNIADPFNGKVTYKTYDLLQGLKSRIVSNSFVYSYVILYKNSQTAFSENSVWSIQDFFTSQYKVEGMDANAWTSILFDKYHTNTVLPSITITKGINNVKHKVIPYIYTLNDLYLNNNNAIMVLIDVEKINNILKGIDLSSGGHVLVRDKNQQVIVSTSENKGLEQLKLDGASGIYRDVVDGQKMIISYVVSAETGWQYVAVQPTDVMLSGMNPIRNYMFLAFGLYFVVGLVLSWLLTQRNIAPVFNIIDLARGSVNTVEIGHDKETKSVSGNPFVYIKHYVEQLNQENIQYRTDVEKQKPLMIITFFERLLNGNYISLEEITASARQAGIVLSGNRFVVVLLSMEELNDLPDDDALNTINARKETIINGIMGMGLEHVYLHNINNTRLALIFGLVQEDLLEIKSYLFETLSTISCNSDNSPLFPLYIAIGGIHDGLSLVSRSYGEALNVMENHAWNFDVGDQKILFYNDFIQNSSVRFYTENTENTLLKALKTGNAVKTREIVESGLGLHNKQPGNSIRLNLYEVMGTVNKTLNEILLVDRSSDIGNLKKLQMSILRADLSMSVEKLYNQLLEAIRAICTYYSGKLSGRSGKQIELVQKYIEEHFASKELCLAQTADNLNISISHLSRLFKDSTGENFANFVETIRIEKAKHLLKETDLSINEIADQVGYSSPNSFARAFKRINTITASEYRDIS